MGERFGRVWADGWAQARPIIDAAFEGREQRFVDLPWKFGTDRRARDTFWTFSYSRVLDAEGRIAGLFIFINEIAAWVEGEAVRRTSEVVARENIPRVQLALSAGAIIGAWLWDLPTDRFTVVEAFARSFSLEPALGRAKVSRRWCRPCIQTTRTGWRRRSARRSGAAALTQRLLAFSRRQTLDPKPTDVNRLVREMEDLVRRTVGPAIVVETRPTPRCGRRSWTRTRSRTRS